MAEYYIKKNMRSGLDCFGKLSDFKVIITGASKGPGKEIAEMLLKCGARVGLIARSKDKLESICKPYPSAAIYAANDLSDSERVTDAFKQIIKKFDGQLDLLIHGVCKYEKSVFKKYSVNAWDEYMNLNVKTIFHLSSLATPFLKKSENYPSIICLLNGFMDSPILGHLNMYVAHSMLKMMIECTALELAHDGIRVNGVAFTGLMNKNEVNQKKDSQVDEFNDKFYQNKILKNNEESLPTTESLAETTLWLASPEASFITGQIIMNDAGVGLATSMGI